MDVSFTACFLKMILCVCTVTDFSADDKASGIKFYTVVHRRPGQGISHCGELCSPEAQNRTNRRAASGRRIGINNRQSPSLTVLVCIYFTFFLTFFFHYAFFLICQFTHLLPDLPIYSFKNRVDPFRFQAGECTRDPNLALVFCMLILCCSIFCYGCMYAFVVFVYFFQFKPRDWLIG